MLILDKIREYVAPIEQRIHLGDVFRHGQPIDDMQRAFIRHVLRPMLPVRFGLMCGKAFSLEDTSSRDDAILIYDALYTLPMSAATPCETMFAMCETALHLDSAHFERCVTNIASLKTLHRTKATAHDVTPTHHMGVFGARYAQLSDDKLNPYLGYVFAHEGITPNVLLAKLNMLIEEGALRPENTPDAIVSFKGGWMIARQTRTGEVGVPRSSFAKFGVWHLGEQLLPMIYVLLNISLSQIQLRGPDLLRSLSALTKQK